MARPTATAAEARVDFDDFEPRFDRRMTVFRGFGLPGTRRFRPCFAIEFFIDRFNGVRFGAARLTAPRFDFARLFAMHCLRGELSKRFAKCWFRTDASPNQTG
jgi:hypothetical protein